MEITVAENSTSTQPAEKCWPTHWLPKAWAMALHRKFSAMYLQKFTSNFQDEITIAEWCTLWAEHLAGIEANQIKFGLSYCAQKHEWPPTTAEFIACCKALPKAVTALPAPASIDRAEGIKRVAAIAAKLQSKPVDGRAYWNRVLSNPNINAMTMRFAIEALEILDGDTA